MRSIRPLLLASSAALLAACGAQDIASPGEGTIVTPAPTPTPTPPTPTPTPPTTGPAADCPAGTANVGVIANLRNCQLSGRITGNLVLSRRAGTIYSLSGRVEVGRDVGGNGQAAGGQAGILTIEPGVVLFGSSGLDFLVVNRGSQIFAEGTATNPIIMTSRQNVEGTATDDSQGQWGGLVVLGRGPISDCASLTAPGGSAGCERPVEGTSDAFYGGDQAADNSGRIRYLQVRYSGFELAPGNELNGITLGGVGSGTTFEYIQVHNSSDDAVEWFGGRVNARYLVLTGNDDDNLDTDLGYKGFIQFVIAVQRAGGQSGDSIIEADSNGNEDALPRQFVRLANFTFVHRSTIAASTRAVLLRGGTDYAMYNGVIVSPRACIGINSATTIQPANAALDERGPPSFDSVFLACAQPVLGSGGVTNDQVTALINAGSNNVLSGTASLTNVFVNGPTEAARPAFANLANVAGSNGFFVNTNYIGAVRDANDTWYRGWTCNSSTANFGSPSSCTTIPTT